MKWSPSLEAKHVIFVGIEIICTEHGKNMNDIYTKYSYIQSEEQSRHCSGSWKQDIWTSVLQQSVMITSFSPAVRGRLQTGLTAFETLVAGASPAVVRRFLPRPFSASTLLAPAFRSVSSSQFQAKLKVFKFTFVFGKWSSRDMRLLSIHCSRFSFLVAARYIWCSNFQVTTFPDHIL